MNGLGKIYSPTISIDICQNQQPSLELQSDTRCHDSIIYQTILPMLQSQKSLDCFIELVANSLYI